MKKFKHIPSGNAFITNGASGITKEGNNFALPLWITENSSDWVEIKDEYPKIISFKSREQIYNFPNGYNKLTDSKDFTNGVFYEIYQVATSETDVWTVGDKVKHPFTEQVKPINKFIICNDKNKDVVACFADEKNIGKLCACLDNSVGNIEVSKLEKAPTPLFITEDSFEILDVLTRVYVVWNKKFTISNERFWDVQIPAEMKECKVFYNKESAEKFVNQNEPRFSIKDIEDALNIKEDYMVREMKVYVPTNKVKQKLGI